MKNIHEDYLRSIVFGFQDSLVSTTGVIAGVAAGTQDKQIVVLAGLVAIMVEALSMGTGQYQSEKAVHQHAKVRHTDSAMLGGIFMAASYFLGGLLPLSSILAFSLPSATYVSIGSAFVGLFILGFLKAKLVKVNPWHSALEILVLGGAATVVGLVVGRIFKV